MDVLFVGIIVILYLLSWGLVKGCEALKDSEKGDKS